MDKWLKMAIFAAFLIAAGYLFGCVCKQTLAAALFMPVVMI